MIEGLKTGIIIQARMDSTRLPGKVLMDINGKPMLSRVIERLKKVKCVDEIIVATTNRVIDDQILELALKENVSCYRGAPYDVLSRYYESAKQFNIDVVVRITADCPLIDPKIVYKVINLHLLNKDKIATNAGIYYNHRTYPRGLDVEVFSFTSLADAHFNASKNYEREHVTPYLYSDLNKILYLKNKVNLSNHRWTVDTLQDIEFIREIYKIIDLYNVDFDYKKILVLLRQNPKLSKINNNVIQKSYLMSEKDSIWRG